MEYSNIPLAIRFSGTWSYCWVGQRSMALQSLSFQQISNAARPKHEPSPEAYGNASSDPLLRAWAADQRNCEGDRCLQDELHAES